MGRGDGKGRVNSLECVVATGAGKEVAVLACVFQVLVVAGQSVHGMLGMLIAVLWCTHTMLHTSGFRPFWLAAA
jgi:hypothetical protein